MSRDDIILGFEPLVAHLVKRYNNGVWDEDLHSEAMITCIICVDKSLHLPHDQISRRVMVWVSNRLINIKRKGKFVEIGIDILEPLYNIDNNDLLIDIYSILEDDELALLMEIIYGATRKEICKEYNIGKSTYYRRIKRIREKVNEYFL